MYSNLVDLLYYSSVHTYTVDIIAIAADYDESGTESHKRKGHWILAHSDRRESLSNNYTMVITDSSDTSTLKNSVHIH